VQPILAPLTPLAPLASLYNSGKPRTNRKLSLSQILRFRKRGCIVKLWIAVAAIFCVPLCASAQTGPKPCEDLKAEIAKKLDAKGVTNYTLTIVDKGATTDGKIVGSCGGGTKSIVYLKTTPAPQPKPAQPKKP